MAKKVVTNDVVKAFGVDIEDATRKLQNKLKGFLIIHPEFAGAALDYDAGEFEKNGETKAWAKFTHTVEVEDETVANHPEVKAANKPSNKKKAKVA